MTVAKPSIKLLPKEKALEALVDLANADKVMNSKTFIQSQELLKISYVSGEYSYAEK